MRSYLDLPGPGDWSPPEDEYWVECQLCCEVFPPDELGCNNHGNLICPVCGCDDMRRI